MHHFIITWIIEYILLYRVLKWISVHPIRILILFNFKLPMNQRQQNTLYPKGGKFCENNLLKLMMDLFRFSDCSGSRRNFGGWYSFLCWFQWHVCLFFREMKNKKVTALQSYFFYLFVKEPKLCSFSQVFLVLSLKNH